jgi:hypothetical protein
MMKKAGCEHFALHCLPPLQLYFNDAVAVLRVAAIA